MAEQQPTQTSTPAPQGAPKVEQIFDDPKWQQHAERPGILEDIGHRLDAFLSNKSGTLKSYIEDIKLAYAMVRDPDFRIERRIKIVVIIALLYLISPLDLVPDVIPVLGLLDDIVVIAYALRQAATELERYRAFKNTSVT